MIRSYRYAILALVGPLALASAAAAQNGAAPASNSQQVNTNTQGGAQRQDNDAADAVAPTDVGNRENTIEPDCGTPKECRAEQREKDDLIAQQTAADAAVSQRNAAWWQTGVGAAGVILLVLTVIYTHLATRAAISSVKIISVVEGPRPNVMHGPGVCHTDGQNTTFTLQLSNDGRTVGTLKETCIQGSHTGMYADFVPTNVEKHNTVLAAGENYDVGSIRFPDAKFKYVVGYYKVKSVFSNKPLTDYFCFELGDAVGPPNQAGRTAGDRAMTYLIDRDWPADESI